MRKRYLLFVALLPMTALAQLTITQAPTTSPTPTTTAQQAQEAWYRGGNTPNPSFQNVLGTFWNSEVHHFTNGIRRFTTSTNAGLTNNGFSAVLGIVNGDGISVANHPSSASFASIDLFTGTSNRTFLRMGQAYLTQTSSNRVEHYANFQGFWHNATGIGGSGTAGIAQHIWNNSGVERGRLGSNGKWRFGLNPSNLVANNRVEIVSSAGDPYFPNASGLRLTNLTSASSTTTINGVNPSKVLTVDINGDVVLTNPSLGAVQANNGLQVSGGFVQLGGNCANAIEVSNAVLLTDRKILMKGKNILFEQTSPVGSLSLGRIGIGDFIGCSVPGNLLDVKKNNAASPLGLSGLRLSDLKAGAFINPPNGTALSVDANGDVILVNAPIGGGGVNFCGPIPVNNVTKVIAPNIICQTNITDLFPFGFVGINNTTPNDGLDVSPPPAGNPGTGDIDVTSATNRYEINDNPVLWHKGNVNDLFVGVGAANNAAITNNNTVVGHNAASNPVNIGVNNTYIGKEAGQNAFGAMDFTFVGFRAGAAHPGLLYTNTFIGAYAGESETGAENVYVGWRAGHNPGGGFSLHNTFVGHLSGGSNLSGNSNTFLGYQSGNSNLTGNGNTLIGDFANVAAPNLNNASAVGAGAIVPSSNQMILGDNTVNVGVGLSGALLGPQNKLELDAGINGTLPSLAGAGASGLRFRDLKSNASTVPNPGPGVLAVDASGDVIYVPGGGTGNVSMCTSAPPNNNVVKATSTPNQICETNIYDLFPTGSVGINITTPNDALDVSPGLNSTDDIDITSNIGAYQINDNDMLLHKGSTDALFLGVGAGASITPGPNVGVNNTVLGGNAHSTFPTMGQNSVFVGYGAGQNTGFQNNSTIVGSEAGANNAPGADENTIVGWKAGFNNSGLHNVFIGNLSGHNNNGFQNTFVGIGSGFNGGGAFNVSIGGSSGPTNNTISNSIAIGNGVVTQNTNNMLLGDNTMHVGIGLNLDPTGPVTSLEIDAGLSGTVAGGNGNPGASGLRFRDLTSLSIPQINPGNGVLSLNNLGDVIYVNAPSGGGGGVGNYCGTPANPLIFDYEVPLNGNDYYFRDDAANTNRVGVGYTCLGGMLGKLNAYTAFPTNGTPFSYAIHGSNNNTSILSINSGVYGESNNPGLSTDAFGVWGKALNSSRRNIGVLGEGGTNPFNNSFGAWFESKTAGNNMNIGVHAEAENAIIVNKGAEATGTGGLYTFGGDFSAYGFTSSLENIGVAGRGFPFGGSAIPTYPAGVSIGVYGQVTTVLPPTLSPDYAGFFDGNVWVNGPASGLGYLVTSDRKFKRDINVINKGLELIMRLKPSTYQYDTKNIYGLNFDSKKQYGFIAQELEEVIPELVYQTKKPAMLDKEGKTITPEVEFKAVNYDGVIPVLVKGVQEQQNQIEQVTAQLEEQIKINKALETRLEQIEKLIANQNTPRQETKLENQVEEIILNQNVPNPFSEKTTIGYKLPASIQKAFIYFYTTDGKLIQKTELTQRGQGELVVYGSNLSSGIYIYSLMADGKIIDRKRMTVK